MTNPIFCALDRPDLEGALALARALAPHVGGIKLGLEFFCAQGPQGVAAVAAIGLPIFLDLKLHDIPNTVAGAVREVGRLGVAMLTVHAAGGRAMLEAAAAAAPSGLSLLAVTVLTSLDEADLASIGVPAAPAAQAVQLGRLALAAGIPGLVCSPKEITPLRAALGPTPRLVVPGIRPATSGDDQKRTMGPAEALALGADVLVIGRPITQAAAPAQAAAALAARLARRREMALKVKICGLTEPARVEQAARLGAAYLGFVCYPPSPRYVDPALARELVEGVPAGVESVGLVVDASDAELDALLQAVPFDVLQLHGYETPERVAQIALRSGCRVIKALRIEIRRGPRTGARLCRGRRHVAVRRQAAARCGLARRPRAPI